LDFADCTNDFPILRRPGYVPDPPEKCEFCIGHGEGGRWTDVVRCEFSCEEKITCDRYKAFRTAATKRAKIDKYNSPEAKKARATAAAEELMKKEAARKKKEKGNG
jgi:hypothetical protein